MLGAGAIQLAQADLGHARRTVLHAVNAEVRPGERILLLGDNGSGKSTLIATLAGLLAPQRGTVRVLGMDPLGARAALHRRVGHLAHGHPFYPELTGAENLTLHADLRGLGGAEAKAALREVGLEEAAGRPVGAYSHGMARRLAVAKALLGAPELLLLDEPESGLDAAARRATHAVLKARRDCTVIVSTHHWDAFVDWADRAWVLGGGRLAVDLLAGAGGLTAAAIEGAQRQAGVRP